MPVSSLCAHCCTSTPFPLRWHSATHCLDSKQLATHPLLFCPCSPAFAPQLARAPECVIPRHLLGRKRFFLPTAPPTCGCSVRGAAASHCALFIAASHTASHPRLEAPALVSVPCNQCTCLHLLPQTHFSPPLRCAFLLLPVHPSRKARLATPRALPPRAFPLLRSSAFPFRHCLDVSSFWQRLGRPPPASSCARRRLGAAAGPQLFLPRSQRLFMRDPHTWNPLPNSPQLIRL